jgi:predicted transcriptional regulator
MILLNQAESASQGARAEMLRKAGFSNAEIADLLGTTAAVVSQQLYAIRGKGAKIVSKATAKKRRP